jgi:hypothetical protein
MDRLSKAAVGLAMAGVLVIGANAWAEEGKVGHPNGPEKGKGGPKNPEEFFQKMDANGDGMVDKNEFVAFHEARAKAGGHEAPSAERIDKRFAALDANSDGNLSKDEFIAGSAKMKEGHGRHAEHGEKPADQGKQ